MNKFKRDYLPVIVAVLAAFVVSTIWFSPLLFGKPWVTLRSQWMHIAHAPSCFDSSAELCARQVIATKRLSEGGSAGQRRLREQR